MNFKRSLMGLGLAAAVSMTAVQAYAVPSMTISGPGLAAAQAAEASFKSFLSGSITEDFESFAAGSQAINYATSVGTFTQDVAGAGGACEPNCANGVAILSNATTPFSGRFPISPSNWLDSFDSQVMTFTLSALSTGVGFYMTDPNDQGGRMDLTLTDGSTLSYDYSNIFGSALGNGKVFYFSIFAEEGVSSITFTANAKKDGFGIDDVTIGNVPEPATLGLMGLGIAGLALGRRRKQ